MGDLRSEVQPITPLCTILIEKVSLSYTFDWKKVGFIVIFM